MNKQRIRDIQEDTLIKDWVSAENNGFIVFCGQTERFITKHQRKYI